MVHELEDGEDWEYRPPKGGFANLEFASASSPDGACVSFFLNDELVEKVYLRVPHSWWMPSQAIGAPTYDDGDVLRVLCEGGRLALRIDLGENSGA